MQGPFWKQLGKPRSMAVEAMWDFAIFVTFGAFPICGSHFGRPCRWDYPLWNALLDNKTNLGNFLGSNLLPVADPDIFGKF